MSVTSVNKLYTQQMGGKSYHRSYRSVYQVITDDITDGPVTIVLDTRTPGSLYLPQQGDYFLWENEYDEWTVVTGEPDISQPRVDGSRKLWHVTITHTTQPALRGGFNRIENPLDEPWQVRLLYDEWTEEANVDPTTGLGLTNTALQPLTGKITEVYKSRDRWQLSKNRATLDAALMGATRGHVNSQPVTIRGEFHAPRTLLLRGVEAEELNHPALGRYYRHSFSLDTNPETFDIATPDVGTRVFVGTDRGDPTHYSEQSLLDPYTQKPPDPPGVYLTDGTKLDPWFVQNRGPDILRLKKYPEVDLNLWQFPSQI